MSSNLEPSYLEVEVSDIHLKESSLLNPSQRPCVLESSQSFTETATPAAYIPLFYSQKIKNPGKSHFVKRVLLGHWAFGVVAWSCLSDYPLVNAFSLFLLTVSYWCVYEIGYQENDTVADNYEKKPNLSATYDQYKSQINLQTPWPWVWAVALAVPGCLLFELSQSTGDWGTVLSQLSALDGSFLASAVGGAVLRDLAGWTVFLMTVRATFWLYNRVNEVTRIWLYPVLQVQQLFGFALLASTSAVGAMLLMSLVISRWIQYCVYRCGGDRKRFPINLSCFLLFSLLFLSLTLGDAPIATLLTWQALIAFVFCGVRATKKMLKLRSTMGWIDRPAASTPCRGT